MRRLHLLGVMVTAAVTTVSVVVPAAPALASSVTTRLRDDDGVLDNSILVNDGGDQAAKRLVLPTGVLQNGTTATLRVYAEATGCGPAGAAHRLTVNGTAVADFNPCDKWAPTAYSWAGFDVPLSALAGGNVATFSIREFGGLTGEGDPASRNAFYGVDLTSDFGRSDIWQAENYYVGNGTDIAGELMWYLDIDRAASVPVRDDDGSPEASVEVEGPGDLARKRLVLPSGTLTGAPAFTSLYVYAKATVCTAPSAPHWLVVNGRYLDFDPCEMWSTTAYSWGVFSIPRSELLDGATNTFVIWDSRGGPTGSALRRGPDQRRRPQRHLPGEQLVHG